MNEIKHNFYNLLDISPDCSPKEIKKSFKKIMLALSKKPFDAKINLYKAAYDTLIDPASRAEYDKGHNPQESHAAWREHYREYTQENISQDIDFGEKIYNTACISSSKRSPLWLWLLFVVMAIVAGFVLYDLI